MSEQTSIYAHALKKDNDSDDSGMSVFLLLLSLFICSILHL